MRNNAPLLRAWGAAIAAVLLSLGTVPATAQDPVALSKQADAAIKAKRFDEAPRFIEQMLAAGERTFANNRSGLLASRRLAAIYYSSLCDTMNDAGRYTEAERHGKRALQILESAGRPSDILPGIASNVGDSYVGLKNFPEAFRMFKWALMTEEHVKGPVHEDVSDALEDLANAYMADRRYVEAEPLYRRALAIMQRLRGATHVDTAWRHYDLAWCIRRQGRHEEAIEQYKIALAIREKLLGPVNERVAWTLADMAGSYYMLNRYAEAEPLYRRALAIREKLLGKDHSLVADTLAELADNCAHQDRYDEAEPLYLRALAIKEKVLGSEHEAVADRLEDLADLYVEQLRYDEAATTYQRAISILEKSKGVEDPDVAGVLVELALVYNRQRKLAEADAAVERALDIWRRTSRPRDVALAHGMSAAAHRLSSEGRHADAEQLFAEAYKLYCNVYGESHENSLEALVQIGAARRMQAKYSEARPVVEQALADLERVFGPDHIEVAEALDQLGLLHYHQAQYAEAERLLTRALAIKEKHHDEKWHYRLTETLRFLSYVHQQLGKYDEAAGLLQRALEITERLSGSEHEDTATLLDSLATVYHNQGRLDETEAARRRALAIREKQLRPDHELMSVSYNNLALVLEAKGRNAEAESLYKKALAINERARGADDPDTAINCNNLARVLATQGRFAEAEPLYRRALAIREQRLGQDHPDVAHSLAQMASCCIRQGRVKEAEAMARRALTISEKVFGKSHAQVAYALGILGDVLAEQERYAEAEAAYERRLSINRDVYGADHLFTAGSYADVGALRFKQQRYDEAVQLYERALAIEEKSLGPEHPDLGFFLFSLAEIHFDQERFADAEALIERAVSLGDRFVAAPGVRASRYTLRAKVSWEQGRRGDALADLREAIDLAEQQRSHISGAEHERAQAFSKYAEVFELMLRWQKELGDPAEAFQAIELGRARSLLDEMGLAGADLNLGRSMIEREQLRQREGELKGRIAALEKKAAAGSSGDPATADAALVQAELAEARQALYQLYREQRGTNPIYRNLLSAGAGPPRLSQIQRRLLKPGSLLLVYFLGKVDGYVLVVESDKAEVMALGVDEEAAKAFGVDPGPLTAERMQSMLMKDDGQGVLQQLAREDGARQTVDRLALLWKTIVPEASREAISSSRLEELLIVPDGALSLLPFETLVLDPADEVTYLLDKGPPIVYGPSATVLYNLAERGLPSGTGKEPVLTVGDPNYDIDAPSQVAVTRSALGELATPSRYRAAGDLVRLPYSEHESRWVADSFDAHGIAATRLLQEQATEANVRGQVAGRRIVHLACHGRTDQSFGNFFGALALTPSTAGSSDPAEDGFLTLPEIYELDLKSCQLAILSACETNYGPQQRGEGVWALSRGFLVAGSRRVVASNWLVDDEAAASLISLFCGGVAEGQKTGQPQYARALQDAKRAVRQQSKWSSPYYWGTFVLVGPN